MAFAAVRRHDGRAVGQAESLEVRALHHVFGDAGQLSDRLGLEGNIQMYVGGRGSTPVQEAF